MTPDGVKALQAPVEEQRANLESFDIVVGGSPGRDEWEEALEYIRSLAAAGITWWIEYVPPDTLESMRASIERGPLRIH